MKRLLVLTLSTFIITCVPTDADTVLSSVLTPKDDTKLNRQSRSYYERYGVGRPYARLEYGRLDYDRSSRCGRCLDDRDDRDEDYDRRRGGYDDDRRSHRPTYGSRYDRNKGDDEDDDRRYNTDRNSNKNGTDDGEDKDKNHYDDKDSRPTGGRRDKDRDRDRDRDRHRDRYDDRDRHRPDYYDRFLGDRRDRDRYDGPSYDDPYRRPLYDRYDDPYERYDGYGYPGYRRPAYDDRYDRVAYDDSYGGYGPGVGRGPHDSFRPWDETYRGQAGWDAGGRGYYFASGRPEAAPAPAQGWGRPEYARPQYSDSGWQNAGYSSGGYREPQYQGSLGYSNGGYRQDLSAGYGQPAVYGQSSGWRNVGERRPYRDQSGVANLDKVSQPARQSFVQPSRPSAYGQAYASAGSYNGNVYANGNGYSSRYPNGAPSAAVSSSTTPNTSYLFQREDEKVTIKTEETTKAQS